MTTNHDRVREFHAAFNQPVGAAPALIPAERSALRIALIEEEFGELKDAIAAGDLVEIADALGDILYVTYGTATEYGLPINEILAEIHRANMSKLGADGKPIYREDGKVLKGPGYTRPDVAAIVNEA